MKGSTESLSPSAYESIGRALSYSPAEIAIMVPGSLGRDYSGVAATLAAAAYADYPVEFSDNPANCPVTVRCPESPVVFNRKPVTVLVAA